MAVIATVTKYRARDKIRGDALVAVKVQGQSKCTSISTYCPSKRRLPFHAPGDFSDGMPASSADIRVIGGRTIKSSVTRSDDIDTTGSIRDHDRLMTFQII